MTTLLRLRFCLQLLLLALCGISAATASAQTTKYFLYETFQDCSGVGGADGQWNTGNITATKKSIVTDHEGWTFEDGYAGKQCAWFGYSSKGYVITPSLDITGNGKIEFKAGAFKDQTDKSLEISVIEGSATLGTTKITMNAGRFNLFTVNISNASPGLRIKISATTAEEKFFFDEFYAYREEGGESGGEGGGGGSEEVGITDPGISFSASSCVAFVGKDPTLPTFNNPNNLTGISFASSNEAVATVDAATGKVTLTGSTGQSQISAIYAGDATYKASTVTYTLNVVSLNSQTFLYKKVTKKSELQEGDSYILVCEPQEMACKSISYDKGQPASVFLSDGLVCQTETAPLCFVLEKTSSYYRLRDAKGNYLNAAASTTNLVLGSSSDNSKWTITFDTNGNAKLQNYKTTDRLISYSVFDHYFGNYTVYGTEYYNSIQLYRKVYNINISEVTQGYSTLYNADNAYTLPEGLQGLMVTQAPRTGYITTVEAYQAGEIVPAQTALLLKGTPNKYYAPVTTNPGTEANQNNWLHGTRTAENVTEVTGANVFYYKLAVDDTNTPGFYWGAENGGPFTLTKPSTAYLAVPKSESTAAALLFDLESSIQEANNEPDASSAFVHDLTGRRVAKPVSGVYIVNGRKVIVR